MIKERCEIYPLKQQNNINANNKTKHFRVKYTITMTICHNNSKKKQKRNKKVKNDYNEGKIKCRIKAWFT